MLTSPIKAGNGLNAADVSGRVTADSIKHGLYAKKQGGEVPMKFAQVLVCVAAVGLLSSCASSSNSPQFSSSRQSSGSPKSSSNPFAEDMKRYNNSGGDGGQTGIWRVWPAATVNGEHQ
jgi:hypothetical protein